MHRTAAAILPSAAGAIPASRSGARGLDAGGDPLHRAAAPSRRSLGALAGGFDAGPLRA